MALLDMVHSFYLLEGTRCLSIEGLGDSSLRGIGVSKRLLQDAAKPEEHTGLLRIVEPLRAILCPASIDEMDPRRNVSPQETPNALPDQHELCPQELRACIRPVIAAAVSELLVLLPTTERLIPLAAGVFAQLFPSKSRLLLGEALDVIHGPGVHFIDRRVNVTGNWIGADQEIDATNGRLLPNKDIMPALDGLQWRDQEARGPLG